MTNLITFSFKEKPVRVVVIDDEGQTKRERIGSFY